MGVQTIIHGRILLNGNIQRSQQVLREWKDENYPIISSEMFSVGATEQYSYYENPVVAFAATYKSVENDWDCFILKFEHLLHHLEFDSAKLQMETEFLGIYHFFWKSKTAYDRFEEKDKFIEMPQWYFGDGFRSRWGILEDESEGESSFPFEFEYPVEVDTTLLQKLRNLLLTINQGDHPKTLYLSEHFDRDVIQSNMFYRVLTYLAMHRELHFGYEAGRGHWITGVMSSS